MDGFFSIFLFAVAASIKIAENSDRYYHPDSSTAGGLAATKPAKMGRKKIKIEKISQPKNRQVTFNKRKVGLMKKAMELSILCDCDIALVVFSSDSKLFQYSSMNIDSIWQRYLEYDGPYESLSNDDVSLSLVVFLVCC
jgi:hypothetical protein